MIQNQTDTTEESWTDDIETVLKNINNNADYLQEEHHKFICI